MNANPKQLREEIRKLVADYHAVAFREPEFIPGKTPIPVSGKVFDALQEGRVARGVMFGLVLQGLRGITQ